MTVLSKQISKLLNYAYSWIVSRGDFIILNGWVNIKYGHIIKRNFGDELNYYILKELTGKGIVGYYDIPHVFKHEDLMFIGSIIDGFTTSNSIIWGSGAISDEKPLRHKPAKICAVRGKLTRQYLLKQGVECPEVYGDPALLLPMVYQPKVEKKYKIGFIPHIIDLENTNIQRLVTAAGNDGRLIRFSNYGDWHTVIDEINECEFIVSSSLHGLIISDAYGIPNVRMTLSDKILGDDFKYKDYYSGVGKENATNVIVDEYTTMKDLLSYQLAYTPIKFDRKILLKASPIKLRKEYET